MTGSTPVTTNSANNYGGVARWFHWAIAAMIVLQFVLAKLGDIAEDDGERLRQLALLANHKSVGMTVLMLAVLRIGWRLLNAPPKLPARMPGWQRVASHISHWSLYAFLFALPVSGWLMSSASAYSVSWFGLFSWPDLVEPSKALRATLHDVHELLGEALFVIALVHIAAALKHHWIDRDGVLRRISSVPSLALFVAVIALGLFVLTDTPSRGADAQAIAADGSTGDTASTAVGDTSAAGAEPVDPAADAQAEPRVEAMTDGLSAPGAQTVDEPGSADRAATEAASQSPSAAIDEPSASEDLPPATESVAAKQPAEATTTPAPAPTAREWQVNYDTSTIRFSAEQAGAEFTGEWQEWQADMQFAADALGDSAFVVRIDVRGVETRDDDRDSTLMDSEWFAAEKYPTVVFRTGAMRATDDGFATDATLEVKGERNPVDFTFSVQADGDQRRLTGSARLDRLALGIGTGEWTDTEWVGQYVDVNVVVNATLQ